MRTMDQTQPYRPVRVTARGPLALEAGTEIAAPVLDGTQLAPSLTEYRLNESAYGSVAEGVGTEQRPPSRT